MREMLQLSFKTQLVGSAISSPSLRFHKKLMGTCNVCHMPTCGAEVDNLKNLNLKNYRVNNTLLLVLLYA